MTREWRRIASLLAVACLVLPPLVRAQHGPNPPAAKLTYPETRKVDQIDDYFGTKVADPYRWLEDENAPATAAWVEAQNRVAFAYLEKIPFRRRLFSRLQALYNYPKYSAPTRRRDRFVFSRNDGLQNQSVWYIQKGLDGTPEVLLDPNTFSDDETSRLGAFSLSKDGTYLGYGISQGGSDWIQLYVMDVASRKLLTDHLEWVKVSAVSWRGAGFYYKDRAPLEIYTDKNAPNGRVVLWDPKDTGTLKDVIPEKPEPLDIVNAAGGKLFVTYLKDVATRAYVYSYEGKLEHEIQLPGLGAAGGLGGRHDDTFVFYTFTSFNFPPTIYKYDIAARTSTRFRAPAIPGFKAGDYDTTQVFYNSKDGTRVPMFLVYKKGLTRNGRNPTLLTGYGGFNITTAPSFNPLRLALLEQGFVFASANMRGGGEDGETWHEAGTKLKKQNVFDDFIAAAEYLIANQYTSPERLAI